MSDLFKLDRTSRMEIAETLWRIFVLIATRIAISFEPEGITIRVAFSKPVNLEGPKLIVGVIEGDLTSYREQVVIDGEA